MLSHHLLHGFLSGHFSRGFSTKFTHSFLFIPVAPHCLLYLSHTRARAHTHLLTPWCRILFEKLIVIHLLKKISCFLMEPEVSLPCSQNPATGPYPDIIQSVHNFTHCSLRLILTLCSHLSLCLPRCFFSRSSSLNLRVFSTCVLQVHPILSTFILGEEYKS